MEGFLTKPKRSLSPTPSTSISCKVNECTQTQSKSKKLSESESMLLVTNSEKSEPSKKKRQFLHNFQKEWLNEFIWVTKTKNNKAFCKCCNTIVVGSTTLLKRHENSAKHIKHYSTAKSSMKIDTFIKDEKRIVHEKMVYSGELKLTMFLHEHNLPFLLMDHITKLIPSICPDSIIAKSLSCCRTKATALTNECLSVESLELLKKNLNESGDLYSLIIDETTDVSVKKSPVIVIRFVDQNSVKDRFLSLIEVESATADSLFNGVLKVLKTNNISIENMLGFAADNASVMMGYRSGIQAKFRDLNNSRFVLGCTCHSLHLRSSAACSKLPRLVEETVRNIYNHFSNSPKRISEFKEFQTFLELKPHKMLRPAQTRWLSLQAVVERVLLLWDALKLYFTNFVFDKNDNLHMDQIILENLKNPVYKLYLLFLSYVLEHVNSMNLQFQSETTQIHNLHSRFTQLYRIILRHFVKKGIIETTELHNINIQNPDIYVKIEDIYIGAKAALFLSENDIPLLELNKVRLNILSFYIELCAQIKKRFNFQDDFLKFLSNFQPKVAMSGSVASILEAGRHFEKLNLDLERLNNEWRFLPDIIPKETRESDFDTFWWTIFDIKTDLNSPMFPNLTKLVRAIMCLPHSSAAAERKFTKLNMVKNDLRNRLNIETCNSILLAADMLGKEETCYSWQPSEQPKYL